MTELLQVQDYNVAELIYNESGAPRLGKARHQFLPLTRDKIPDLVACYDAWCKFDEYLWLEKFVRGKKEEDLYVLCSKRGNRYYNLRMDKKLGFLKKFRNYEFFDDEELKNRFSIEINTVLIWVNLTFDIKLDSLHNAWVNDGLEYNRWLTNVKRYYKDKYNAEVHALNFIQPFPGEGPAKGYCHHHVALLIKGAPFHVHQSFEESKSGSWELVYRLDPDEEKDLFNAGDWHSPVTDIKVLRTGYHVYNYCAKYVYDAVTGSSSENEESKNKSLITNAILWLYRKRAFTMTGEFREAYSSLLNDLHNSTRKKLIQRDLEGLEIPGDWNKMLFFEKFDEEYQEITFKFMGIVPGWQLEEILGRKPGWSVSIPSQFQVNSKSSTGKHRLSTGQTQVKQNSTEL